MAGTPPKVVTPSRSMSSSARLGSQRCIMTSLPPASTLLTRMEWQPVAWNRGTDSSMTLGPSAAALPAPSEDAAAACRPARMATKNRLMGLVQMLRWVPSAPLGRPVVPEV